MGISELDSDSVRVDDNLIFGVTVSSLPALTFNFEQFGISGLEDTGGALWLTDRVMAEHVAASLRLPQVPADRQASESSEKALALVLGCGASPLSGLVACALGWDVVMTDLEVVVQQTRKNLDRNSEALRQFLEATGRYTSSLSPPHQLAMELPWGNLDDLAKALDKMSEDSSNWRLVVLCSDCIVKRPWHMPLLETIAYALCRVPPERGEAFVAFEHRDPFVEHAFLKHARSELFGFEVAKVDVSEAMDRVDWPERIRERLLANSSDYERFLLYRLVLPAELGPAMLERKLWWDCVSGDESDGGDE